MKGVEVIANSLSRTSPGAFFRFKNRLNSGAKLASAKSQVEISPGGAIIGFKSSHMFLLVRGENGANSIANTLHLAGGQIRKVRNLGQRDLDRDGIGRNESASDMYTVFSLAVCTIGPYLSHHVFRTKSPVKRRVRATF